METQQIEQIRAEIAAGTYETPAKIERAVDKLFDAVCETEANMTFFDETPEERALSSLRSRSDYVRRLAALLGDGSQWEYRGQCADLGKPIGKCACGHRGIRYEFTIHHPATGRQLIVGSTCITTFSAINARMVEAIEADAARLEAEARARIAAAREAARAAEVDALLAELHAAAWRLDSVLAGIPSNWRGSPSRRLKRAAWLLWLGAHDRIKKHAAGAPHPRIRLRPLKRRSAQIADLKRRIAETEALIADPYE